MTSSPFSCWLSTHSSHGIPFAVIAELDAQEQRIYQLQTKQRERQAELEQKCSRIQQLSQDLEASHQLQEEAQKQLHVRNSWEEEQSHLLSMSMEAHTRTNGHSLHQERFRFTE
ncbi:uncharacterized protein LOC115346149 isoform X1 [Aquila chrysaetos chrysaetos]|uniref:uncharacterized protein LOC115346149 isoform X1 n=1 Tax=Aquila chrysaetos chrysaetos TaxID=223781 RepID=UPI00117712C2|nr:uncharacterized protein LOC115346149 isoform X1 [Aquila chrysaetos chrysaetos]